MNRAARILRVNAEKHARLMAEEMGKPLKTGIAESEKCAWVCDYVIEFINQNVVPLRVAFDSQPLASDFNVTGHRC